MINLLECTKGKGRSKKSSKEMNKEDLNFLGLTEDMEYDKSL